MNQKQYKPYLFLAVAIMVLSSCKNYFDVDTSDRQTEEKTFSTVEGFKKALAGTYTTVYSYYTSQFYRYPEVAGNMTDLRSRETGSLVEQYDFKSDPEQEIGAVGYIWRYIFVSITNANNIINHYSTFIAKNPGAKSSLDTVKAQALFIRALAHFDLCRTYAQPYNYTGDAGHDGVPVVLKNPAPEDAVERATVKQVYDQVIADLKEAEQLFGSNGSDDAYFASKKAVQALLARVYLYAGNWDEAITYATTVINNSALATGTDYAAMFTNLIPGREAIFRLNGYLQSKTNNLSQVYSLKSPVYVPADTLMKLFDPADIRLNLFQKDPENAGKWFTRKWSIAVDYNANTERYDPLVLRTSEMYLIRAEANLNKNNLPACAGDLKRIIGRALDKDPQSVALTETDKTVLDRTLTVELAKEFCFEGHNFFDITRRKQNLVRGATTASIVKSLNYPSNYFVLPIPQSELDANPGMAGNPTVNR